MQLYNDSVPKPGLSKAQAEEEAERNREWQENTFQNVTTPLYILFKPAKDRPVEDGKLKGVELGRRGGKIFDNQIGDFVTQLKGALNGQVAQKPPLDWHFDYRTAWEKAIKEDKPLFLDFGAITSIASARFSKEIADQPEVRPELDKFVRARLYTDRSPRPGLTSEEATAEGIRNQKWLDESFGSAYGAVYVAFEPAKDRPFDGDKLRGEALKVWRSKEFPETMVGPFVKAVLQEPLSRRGANAGRNSLSGSISVR